jgi:hypothetical protein
MKTILVMDLPESCSKCPFFGDNYADMCCKAMSNRTIDYPYPKDFRHEWCPLKALPQKDEVGYRHEWSNGYKAGWNECLDAILS